MRTLGLAVLVGGVLSASSAWAVPTFDLSAEGASASTARENQFVGSLGSFTRETFNGLPHSTGLSLSSAVGVFNSTTAGQQGQIISVASGDNSGRGVGPLSGNYLESRDSIAVSWIASLGGALFNAIGFYIQDAGDQGALLNIRANDGTGAQTTTVQGPDGNTRYVTISFDHLVSQVAIDFINTGSNIASDGWGLGNITIGRLAPGGGVVPEPASLALLASGLLGLGVLVRQRRTNN